MQLEKRMYFFVPYQLTGIQKGIQCGHCAEQYGRYNRGDRDYNDYLADWKTWIIPASLRSISVLDDANVM